MVTASEIVSKATQLGYDKCGIIPLETLKGFTDNLKERIRLFPETKDKHANLFSLAAPSETYPWAKAIVVCSFWYGKYSIPKNLQGRIAKYYLTDGRRNSTSPGYQASIAFEDYLQQHFRTAFKRDFGIVPLRWAAAAAGLGIFRKNNFFYTEKGSWQYLEAFLIDQPLTYVNTHSLRPCAKSCTLCVKACPTNSLSAPYAMNRNTCISDLTTWNGWDLTTEPRSKAMGNWVYGCDACQDACPYNKQAWTEEQEFPGLSTLGLEVSLTKLVDADYTWLEQELNPLLWYIPKEMSWRYKTNALNAMRNSWKSEYKAAVQKACQDEKEPVRRMANWVLQQIKEDNTDE